MKKLLLILSLSLLTTFGFGQTYKRVKIDSLISVSLPSVYTRKDTLGQSTFTAKASYGFIVVTRIPNGSNNAPLKKEKDLKNVFKNYVKDVQQVGAGSIVNERDTTVGTLKGHLFSLKTDDNNGTVQFRKFLFLYTQDASYTFQYFYNDLQSELINTDVKAFYSSIKLAPDLQRNDQYLAIGGRSMYGAAQIAMYGGGLLIIFIIVFVTIRRRRRRRANEE
jgi:hypothetical protein